MPTVYTAYNVLVGANQANQTLTLQYNSVLGNSAVEVTNVPIRANCHTTLSGDVYNLGLVRGEIQSTIVTGWEGEDSVDF